MTNMTYWLNAGHPFSPISRQAVEKVQMRYAMQANSLEGWEVAAGRVVVGWVVAAADTDCTHSRSATQLWCVKTQACCFAVHCQRMNEIESAVAIFFHSAGGVCVA